MDKLTAYVASRLPDEDLGVIDTVVSDIQRQIDGTDTEKVSFIECNGVVITIEEAKKALED
jgi:predicted alpha-1,6-mannanase (GH76 family)